MVYGTMDVRNNAQILQDNETFPKRKFTEEEIKKIKENIEFIEGMMPFYSKADLIFLSATSGALITYLKRLLESAKS